MILQELREMEINLMKKDSMDMLTCRLNINLILFALPIALSSMLQQLFNAADTYVVGHFADSGALAAVGTNGEIVALLVTLSAGLSIGSNVLIARCIGEKRKDKINPIVHTSILAALIIGILFAVCGLIIARPLLVLIKTPDEILTSAVRYLKIYFLGMPFLMIYDFGSAILRANGNSRYPFIVLTLSGIINVALNLIFVVFCNMGVSGVALATDIATAFSAVVILIKLHSNFSFSLKMLTLNKSYLADILKIGIPSAIQGAVFCFANIFVQASVNSFGTIATAGSTIAMNFEYFGYYMITAFSQTATTFVSQNYAARHMKRCVQIFIKCTLFSILLSALITVPITVFSTQFAGLFSSDSAVCAAACLRIALILAFEPVCGLYEVPAGILRGTGHAVLPAVITITGTCLLRIVWIFTVFARFHSLNVLFIVFPVSWVVTTILMLCATFFTGRFPRKQQLQA